MTLAAELGGVDIRELAARAEGTPDAARIVREALALERDGLRQESIALLERFQHLDTDIKGTLGGRIKRIWLDSGDLQHARRAFELYGEALALSTQEQDHEQIYYHAINLAFLQLVAFERSGEAAEKARLAKAHCLLASDQDRYWNLATQAEAELYLGRPDEALRLYRWSKTMDVEEWQFASTALQAGRIALHLQDSELASQLDDLFTPQPPKDRVVFVSYAREDERWKDALVQMMEPHLRSDETLKLWVDREDILSGDEWLRKIEEGLASAAVAVILVSAAYLASKFVADRELPAIVRASQAGELKLIWLYVSPAAYEATDLVRFQAAHDPGTPLLAMDENERQDTFKRVAAEIASERLTPRRRRS